VQSRQRCNTANSDHDEQDRGYGESERGKIQSDEAALFGFVVNKVKRVKD
jgi:hypothetical protein